MNKIIERIQKLLALAADQSDTPEGERAAEFAEQLMREHAISMAQLDTHEQEKVDPITGKRYETSSSGWKKRVMWALARHCSCRAVYHTGMGSMTVVGHASDVEVCLYLYELCLRQIDQAAKDYLSDVAGDATDYWDISPDKRHDYEYEQRYIAKRWDFEPSLRGFRRWLGTNFRESAADGLQSKLRAIRDAAKKADEAGTALVLQRADKASKEFQRRYPHLRTERSRGRLRNDAGYGAGKNINLTPGVGGSGRTKELA